MKNKKNIVLIGMPAVGKSTIGILLAKHIGYNFVDTDILIQSREKKTLAEIIKIIGVKKFLLLEQEHLLSINCKFHVIATGGSAVYSIKGMEKLSDIGIIIYLKIGLDYLKKRLSALDSRGVIRSPGQDITSLYHERTPIYSKYADITIGCNGLTPDQVLSKIIKNITHMRPIS